MRPTDARRVELHAASVRAAEAALRDAVALARGHGATWTELGRALGVTRQAAQQRFGRPR